MQYGHLKIEAKWQDHWYKHKTFKADMDPEKEKLNVLEEMSAVGGGAMDGAPAVSTKRRRRQNDNK